jgi:hypothetical protein
VTDKSSSGISPNRGLGCAIIALLVTVVNIASFLAWAMGHCSPDVANCETWRTFFFPVIPLISIALASIAARWLLKVKE